MRPQPGTRILYNGQPGTVRYLGSVDGTKGEWIGVDWDDPERGKHDGVKNNKRYFTTRYPRSGSFIRISPAVKYGTSFLEAVQSKYLEDLHGSETQETVILGSSLGAIEVEAVNLDKIRSKLARLDRLRNVSLDGTAVAYADPPGKIKETCPNIRYLNLSLSLVYDWKDITSISSELVYLDQLALNRNRLLPPQEDAFLGSPFPNLTELELNDIRLSWEAIQSIIAHMPRLQSLEVGFNNFTALGSSPIPHNTLQTLNLDNNALSDWVDLATTIDTSFPSLEKVILTSNKFSAIPPNGGGAALFQIKYLALASNALSSWSDLENLSRWLPGIRTLSLRMSPITTEAHARSRVIAYFPTLHVLDGTNISSRERSDSEILYLGDVAKTLGDVQEGTLPFRWHELCEIHGNPNASAPKQDEDKLGSKLIALHFVQVSGRPTKDTDVSDQGESLTLTVLPSMALRSLRAKVKRAAGKRANKVMFWIKMNDGEYVELEEADDSHTLDWIGLEDGTQIVYSLL
ncbi:tubulin-specific chaperone e [Coprinopsis cinerea AmutBmut pab1-1]|nr:tubulin-specific chaperone e [Coprinopsis cinerea AmutBmut pab1-1]